MKNADKPIYPDPQRGAEQSQSNQAPWQLDSGLTKREYFAGLAMQALISNPNIKRPDKDDVLQYESFSTIAIEYADALLKQLEAKTD